MGVFDPVDKLVDEAEDEVQGATGIDFGGSGGGKNAADVTDKNENTSQGATDKPGQAVEEATEGVGQAVDKAEDAAQETTGQDLGGSGGGSDASETDTTESSLDAEVGGEKDGSESDVVKLPSKKTVENQEPKTKNAVKSPEPPGKASNVDTETRQELADNALQSTEPGTRQRRRVKQNLKDRGFELVNPRDRNLVPQQQTESVVQGAVSKFINPSRQVDENLNAAGELTVAGQEIIQDSQKTGQEAAEKIPNYLGSPLGGTIAGFEYLGGRNTEKAARSFIPFTPTELENKRTNQIQAGIVSGAPILGGFAIGGAGAIAKTAEQEIEKVTDRDIPGGVEGPTTGAGLAGGASKIAKDAQENPVDFVVQEGSEEIGETLATAGLGLLTVTPDPTVEVNTPEKAQEAARVVKGDLGVRAEDPTVIGDIKSTEGVKRSFQNREEGGRRQKVVGFSEESLAEGDTTLLGERVERPVTRREYLKETLGVKDKELADALNPNAIGLGPGSLVPPESKPESEVEPDTTGPGIDEEDLFRSIDQNQVRGAEPLPESVTVPVTGLTVDITQNLNQGLGQEQDPEIDKQQDTGLDTGLFERQRTESRTEVGPKLEQKLVQPERTVQIESSVFNSFNSPRRVDSKDEEDDGEKQGKDSNGVGLESDTRFATSLAGEFFGSGVTEEEAGKVLTGLEIRLDKGSEENPLKGF